MQGYEYKTVFVEPPKGFFLWSTPPTDLEGPLNREAQEGWQPKQVIPIPGFLGAWSGRFVVLLEREVRD